MNKTTTYNNFCIFLALLRRDLTVMKYKLKDMIIDSLIVVATEVLVLGKLYPLLGMSADFIAPLYIGSSITFILFDLGYSFAMRYTYYTGYEEMSYQLTLPAPKHWIIAEHIVYFVIESLIVTIPLISIGIFALSDVFGPINGSWILFTLIYLLTLIYFGTFFFASSFWYEKSWFQDNMWPRRLSILLFFSSAFYAWVDVAALSPLLGKILLLNPLTYVVEAMRGALLGQENYLPLFICIPIIVACILFDFWRTSVGIKKRLDPV